MSDFNSDHFWAVLDHQDASSHLWWPEHDNGEIAPMTGALVALFARMMAEHLVSRVGDEMVTSDSYAFVALSIDEQRAVRIIEEAIAASREDSDE